MFNPQWPEIFAALMGLALLLYVILDGFDLGVGLWINQVSDAQKDQMIASIAPFWDANQTWLVMGIGLLLVAFPSAHGLILTALYGPVTVMLIGLILRGVAFEYRVKAHFTQKTLWNRIFYLGSFTASIAQGYMLGRYLLAFSPNFWAILFAVYVSFALSVGYRLMGAVWVIFKCTHDLRTKAIGWAKDSAAQFFYLLPMTWLFTAIFKFHWVQKWLDHPVLLFLFLSANLLSLKNLLQLLNQPQMQKDFLPLLWSLVLFVSNFMGLAYSVFPDLIPDQMSIDAAASSDDTLHIIFKGVVCVLPMILLYTAYAYYVFRGKVTEGGYGD